MSEQQAEAEDDPIFTACVDMVGRTGAEGMQVRWSDDEEPTIWMSVAIFPDGRYEVAAGQTPRIATFRLVERLMDGGHCKHCSRPTGVSDDFEGRMLLDQLICWYRFDPELKTFRRGCEGEL